MRGQPNAHTIAFRAKHLAASELIFGYLEGWIVARTPDGGENHEPGQLILTNQRLCLYRSGQPGDQLTEIDLPEVTSVEKIERSGFRYVRVRSAADELIFRTAEAQDIWELVLGRLENVRADPSWEPPGQTGEQSAPPWSKYKEPPKALIIGGAAVWALIVAAAVISNNRHDAAVAVQHSRPATGVTPPVGPSTTPTADQPAANQPTFIHELPLTKVGSSGGKSSRALSADARELKGLWARLEAFRFDPKFHILGLDYPLIYGEWAGDVKTLNARAGTRVMRETGIAPMELLELATDYQRSRGNETDHSRWVAERLAGALNPAPKAAGQGRAIINTEGCTDFEKLARSSRALDEGKFIESNQLLDQAGCSSIAAGAVVGAPTRRRSYDWVKSEGSEVYVYVSVNGQSLWVNEREVAF